MKMFKLKYITNALIIGLMAFTTQVMVSSCDDNPDEFKLTSGEPHIEYVRVPNKESADSLIDAAFMESTICLVGDNLTSIRELWFNDQKAILNTSYITDRTLIVSIPKTIPESVTNSIYMVTKDKDTLSYPFKVIVPTPLVSSISCEYAKAGDQAVIYGNYLIDDPSDPLTITMAGDVPVTNIISVDVDHVVFTIPEGAQKGYISVKSIYGTGRSKFQFRDDRNMILDWDNLDAAGGWRAGDIQDSNPEGITGKYVYFHGAMVGDNPSDFTEDGRSFNLWGSANGRPKGDFFTGDPQDYELKFEINVTEDWSANALQMIFTPWSTNNTNSYIADKSVPRGIWKPWAETGSYKTDGWVTVSFPLKNFHYDAEGNNITDIQPVGNYGGLTFFVYNGGEAGKDCNLSVCIDNIRVVPIEK